VIGYEIGKALPLPDSALTNVQALALGKDGYLFMADPPHVKCVKLDATNDKSGLCVWCIKIQEALL
jgi:hypothetical protein